MERMEGVDEYLVEENRPESAGRPDRAGRNFWLLFPWVPLTIALMVLIGWGNLLFTWVTLCSR